MKNNGHFEGIIDFNESSFNFSGALLGLEISFIYNNQSFLICFPQVQFEERDSFNKPKVTLKNTKVRLNWLSEEVGTILSWNEEENTVLIFSCNKLIVCSQAIMSYEDMIRAKENLLVWKDLFISWFEAITYFDSEKDNVTVEQKYEIECYMVPSDKTKQHKRIQADNSHHTATIHVNLPGEINLDLLKKILNKVSNGIGIPIYYTLLLSSLKEYNNKQYRQSILDSATAIEIVLAKILDDCLITESPSVKKVIYKAHKTAGIIKYVNTLNIFGKNLVKNDIDSKIAKPRNKSIHEGDIITEMMARDALEYTKNFIYKQYPLS